MGLHTGPRWALVVSNGTASAHASVEDHYLRQGQECEEFADEIHTARAKARIRADVSRLLFEQTAVCQY
jgi:hypothetical protein